MLSKKTLILVIITLTLILAILPWILLPEVKIGGYEGALRLNLEEQKALLEELGVKGGEQFYIIAHTKCPWCALQLKFFSKEFPEKYAYCYIDNNPQCLKTLQELAEKTGGLIGGVPTTLVIQNNQIKAIIVGYKDDKKLWEQLLTIQTTEEIPINPTGINPQIKAKIAISTIIIIWGIITIILTYKFKKK